MLEKTRKEPDDEMIKTAPVYAGGFYCIILYGLCLLGVGIVVIYFSDMQLGITDPTLRSTTEEVTPFFMTLFGGFLVFAALILLASNLVRFCVLCPGVCCKGLSGVANKEVICMLYGRMLRGGPPAAGVGEDEQQQFPDEDVADGHSPRSAGAGKEALQLFEEEGPRASSQVVADGDLQFPERTRPTPKMSCSSYLTTPTPTPTPTQTEPRPPGGKLPTPRAPASFVLSSNGSEANSRQMRDYERLREELIRVTERLNRRDRDEGGDARGGKESVGGLDEGQGAPERREEPRRRQQQEGRGDSDNLSPASAFNSVSGGTSPSSTTYVGGGSASDTRESPLSLQTTSDSSYRFWRAGRPWLSEPSLAAAPAARQRSFVVDSCDSLATVGFPVVAMLSDLSLRTISDGRGMGSVPGAMPSFRRDSGRGGTLGGSDGRFIPDQVMGQFQHEESAETDDESTATIDEAKLF